MKIKISNVSGLFAYQNDGILRRKRNVQERALGKA